MTIIKRSFSHVEPNVASFDTDPYGAWYVAPLYGLQFPSWFPDEALICDCRIGHQAAPGAASGELAIGIDVDGQGYRMGMTAPHFEDGDWSRWISLGHLWPFHPFGEQTFHHDPPALFRKNRDLLWVDRTSTPDMMWWQLVYLHDTATENPNDGYHSPLHTVFSEPLLGESTGWAGYCIRLVIPQSTLGTPFEHLQLALIAPGLIPSLGPGEPMNVSGIYLGQQAVGGNPWDFVAPVQLKLNGNGSFTIPRGMRLPLDEVTFHYGGTGNLVLSFAVADNGLTNALRNTKSATFTSIITRHTKANGAADVAVQAPTGFNTGLAANIALAWIATR